MTTPSDPASVPAHRFSDPVPLWCPYCHHPFVGSVELRTGRFVHGDCPIGALDLARIRRLARSEWFWARFLARLGQDGDRQDGPRAA